MSKVEDVLNIVKEMSVLELSELVKAFEEEFGVTAAAPMAVPMAGAVAAGGAAAEPAEEKTEFDVILTAAGEKKINVIKVVRELTSLGLKEAKTLVDEAPNPVKEGINKGRSRSHQSQAGRGGAPAVEIK